MTTLYDTAAAKINLSLHVLGRRLDGYHELESLVVFADIADDLAFTPGRQLSLTVAGEAAAAGPVGDNLVLRAARHLAGAVAGLDLGHFHLTKRLPVAAGLGGGSSDAAAALRLLARHNGLSVDDPRVLAAALATGADCTVCLDPRPALMRGAGERVERLFGWPTLDGVLVNPRVEVPTRAVFEALGLAVGSAIEGAAHPALTRDWRGVLSAARNDLAAPARRVAPVIADVEAALTQAGAWLVRMSGSGATVAGLAASPDDARAIATEIERRQPAWWVAPVRMAGSAATSALGTPADYGHADSGLAKPRNSA